LVKGRLIKTHRKPVFEPTCPFVRDPWLPICEGCGCRLCQVGVPRETRISVRKVRKAYEKGALPPPLPSLA